MKADFSALFEQGKRARAATDGAQEAKRPRLEPTPQAEAAKKKNKKKKNKGRSMDAPGKPRSLEQPPGERRAAGAASSSEHASASKQKPSLQQRVESQLAGGRFRFINEILYTRPSTEAQELFVAEPELFSAYHQGFRSQSARWPQNPVHLIAQWLQRQPDSWEVADLGCGDAELALSVRQRVHSFDLVAANPRVTACDIAKVPLASGTLDAVVFCLALMGSNYVDFLREAHRLLRPKGALKVAEVSSRFHDLDRWIEQLRELGFLLKERNESNTHFVLLQFERHGSAAQALEGVPLKPCIYKRR
jgi:ribosomal RNA-processing protein 8